jgi:hypothetical protein
MITSLWQPIPSNQIKSGMTVDVLEVSHKSSNIIGFNIKKNQKLTEVRHNVDGTVHALTENKDIIISNIDLPDVKYDAYFFTAPGEAEKGLMWIELSSERENGRRMYKNFVIDLPGEGPFDRIVKSIRESKILDKPTPTVEQLARKHGVTVRAIETQLSRGIEVETEHTTSKKLAREIALDHLSEDPAYYTKLDKANLEEGKLANLLTVAGLAAAGTGGLEVARYLDQKFPNPNKQPQTTAPAATAQKPVPMDRITVAPKQEPQKTQPPKKSKEQIEKEEFDRIVKVAKSTESTPEVISARRTVLLKAAQMAGITGPELSNLLGQSAKETQDWKFMEEQSYGKPKYFSKYEPGTPSGKILGNTKVGDGERFKGRGYLHLTGRWNYAKVSADLGYGDLLVRHPELVATDPEIAAATAIWYWKSRVAHKLSDPLNVKQSTQAINPNTTKKSIEKRQEKVRQQYQIMQNEPEYQGIKYTK